MNHEDETTSTLPLMHLTTWLTGQFSQIHAMLGALREGQMASRRAVATHRSDLIRRMERLEMRIANGHGRYKYLWLKHLPWTRIALMLIAGILLITGHLTVTEIKAWLAKAIAG